MSFFRIQPLQQRRRGERARGQFGNRPRGGFLPTSLRFEAFNPAQKLRALRERFPRDGLVAGNLLVAFAELTFELRSRMMSILLDEPTICDSICTWPKTSSTRGRSVAGLGENRPVAAGNAALFECLQPKSSHLRRA